MTKFVTYKSLYDDNSLYVTTKKNEDDFLAYNSVDENSREEFDDDHIVIGTTTDFFVN